MDAPFSPGAPGSASPDSPESPDQTALAAALNLVLRPLAALAIARGLPYAAVEELLRQAFVDVARDDQPGQPAHGLVSRISTATGLSRREVTRLVQPDRPTTARPRWLAGELFTRWLGDPGLKPRRGAERRLPRQGPAPSFESLAQSITRDVHPRSLLDELCRLGLARLDDDSDSVVLVADAFVPKGDFSKMVAFLGDNVGDHLSAAVANTTDSKPRHLEQAIFADELSTHSLETMRVIVTEQWQTLFDRLVPTFESLIADDRAAGRPQNQRMRVGLYTYSTSTDASPDDRRGDKLEGSQRDGQDGSQGRAPSS